MTISRPVYLGSSPSTAKLWVMLNLVISAVVGLAIPIIAFVNLFECVFDGVRISLLDPHDPTALAVAVAFMVLQVLVILLLVLWGNNIEVLELHGFYDSDLGLLVLNIWAWLITPFVFLIIYAALLGALNDFRQSGEFLQQLTCPMLNCSGDCFPGNGSVMIVLISLGLALSVVALLANALLMIRFYVNYQSRIEKREPSIPEKPQEHVVH